ncbi:MAG: cytochrome C, partial [Spirochaetes bacterium]
NPPADATPGDPNSDIVNKNGHEGFQMSFGTKCTTCHKVVHGSDFPSQPLSGGGLTR